MAQKFLLLPHQLQPSQLYISQVKLERTRAWFPALPEEIEPIPIIALDGALVMTDGHTRACAALLSGWRSLPVVWDCDELDLDAYRVCVQWCQEEGVASALALPGRIISGAAYRVLWEDRCTAMHRQLAQMRGKPDE